jgi:hypothetical protein
MASKKEKSSISGKLKKPVSKKENGNIANPKAVTKRAHDEAEKDIENDPDFLMSPNDEVDEEETGRPHDDDNDLV